MNYLNRLLADGEEIVFQTHRHWTSLLGEVWLMLLCWLGGCAVAIGLNLTLSPGGNQELSRAIAAWPIQQQVLLRVGIFFVFMAVPTGVILLRYFRWRAEQFVITSLRVIRLRGVLSKQVLDSSLEKVNDVLLEQSLAGRMLDFGNIDILTASELGVNKFVRVSQPIRLKAAMLNAKQSLEAGRPA